MTLLRGIDFRWELDIPLDRILTKGGAVLAILVVGWAVYRLGRIVIRRAGGTPLLRPEAQQRAETARGVLLSAWKYVVLLGMAAALVALVPGATLPTAAVTAAAGLVIAFGAQWLFRDVIAGFSILMEGQYVVGDRIRVYGLEGVEGVVESVGLRVTVVRADDGSRVFVPNGSIAAVRNLGAAAETPAVRERGRGGRARAPARAPAAEPQPAAATPAPEGAVVELGAARTAPPEAAAAPAEAAGASARAAGGRRGRRRRRSSRRRAGEERPAPDRGEAAPAPAPPQERPAEPVGEPRDVLEDSPWSIE